MWCPCWTGDSRQELSAHIPPPPPPARTRAHTHRPYSIVANIQCVVSKEDRLFTAAWSPAVCLFLHLWSPVWIRLLFSQQSVLVGLVPKSFLACSFFLCIVPPIRYSAPSEVYRLGHIPPHRFPRPTDRTAGSWSPAPVPCLCPTHSLRNGPTPNQGSQGLWLVQRFEIWRAAWTGAAWLGSGGAAFEEGLGWKEGSGAVGFWCLHSHSVPPPTLRENDKTIGETGPRVC